MKITQNCRGFQRLEHDPYLADGSDTGIARQSSAIGDYSDSVDKPGSSFLWIGRNHHLDREEVAQLVAHLQSWLKTGSFKA